jgi:hypothetical protein
MPKILLLEHHIEKKIKNNEIHITIAYEESNYHDMKFLKKAIEDIYSNGISGYKIVVDFIDYNNFQKYNVNTNMLYIFPSSQANINKLIKEYKLCSAIIFASQKEYLKNNAMISIDVGKKVKPIINLDAIRSSGISFKPVLLSISKVFNNHD